MTADPVPVDIGIAPGTRRAIASEQVDGGPPRALRARLRAANRAVAFWGGVGVCFVYLGLYGWFLLATNGLPYVMDNNESFSSLVHASNLATYGLNGSFGLTDESYGTTAAAHPYVHTHQGNFPRLFAFLIYVLGAKSIQAQIVVTTLSVGLLAIILMYYFFATRVSTLFAVVACAVFMSDYIFFAQWQVVTYRVWHPLFVFGALVCVERMSRGRRRLWTILLGVTFAALFYYEFIFVAFVAVLTGLYAAVRYRPNIRLIARIWATQIVGACVGLAILIVQLVAFLGWSGLTQDISMTYLARNEVGDNGGLTANLSSFYSTHNIVFWYNLVDATGLRSPGEMLRLLFTWSFQVFTPSLSLIVLLLVGGWTLAELCGRLRFGRPAWRWSASILLAISTYLFTASVFADDAAGGVAPAEFAFARLADWQSIPIALVGATIVLVVVRFAERKRRPIPFTQVFGAGIYIALGYLAVEHQWRLYDQYFRPLWFDRIELMLPMMVWQLLILAAALLGVALILLGPVRLLGPLTSSQLRWGGAYLACAAVAYVVTYVLSPGYVFSGYLVRSAPLTVFLTDVLVAFAFVLLLSIMRHIARVMWRRRTRVASSVRPGPSRTILPLTGLGGAMLTVLFTLGFWAALQRAYVDMLPPNHFAFMTQLGTPPYAGQSFAVDTYAAPVHVFTGQWAYFDTTLDQGKTTVTNDGYRVERDLNSYLWLADKQTNGAYQMPTYFLCIAPQGFSTALTRLTDPTTRGQCAQEGIVRAASQEPRDFPRDRIVDADPGGEWAVVKLDWDYPPYLASLTGRDADSRVDAIETDSDTGLAVEAQYDARQQSGAPQLPPIVRLYAGSTGTTCVITESDNAAKLLVPDSYVGPARLSVTPRTSTSMGQEYFSQPFDVDGSLYRLPNVVTGQPQLVRGRSLADAERLAAARGTWNPSAGTFGEQSAAGSSASNTPACSQS